MGKERADKIMRTAAYIVNGLAFAGVLGIGLERSLYGEEFLLWLLQLSAPCFAVIALWSGPGREERLLRRRVALAELRARLRELGEEE